MDLIPRAVVVGVFAATPAGLPDRDRVNRVWSELSGRQDYRQLTVTADGAQFTGASTDDALLIQPPLVQVRSSARLGVPNAADEAQVALRAVSRHLSWDQFFNLGIKLVFSAPVPGSDARSFVLQRLLHDDGAAHEPLERGGDVWAGIKYGAPAVDGSAFIVAIEPLLADNQLLFIDIDANFPGPIDLDKIADRAAEAHEYATRAVSQYLDAAN